MESLTGMSFGELTVIGTNGRNRHGHWKWKCRCSCGTEKDFVAWLLRSGNARSCGCKTAELLAQTRKQQWAAGVRRRSARGWKLGPPSEDHRRKLAETSKTHGMSASRVYMTWTRVIQRCTDARAKDYQRYGGRGILVCERWRASFEAFLSDMGQPPTAEHSIDRINNDGNYEPGNCRWATRVEQANNRRSNRRITFRGESMTVANLAMIVNVPQRRLHQRLRRGYSVEEAIALG